MTSSNELELKAWLLASRQGDEAAYRSFLERTAKLARSFLRNSVKFGDESQIEDLVQETLLAIHSKKHLYDEAQPVLPWIYAIARYRMIDSFRKKGARPAFVDIENFEEIFTTEETPESELTALQSLNLETSELLSGLSEQQRKILYMAKVEEVPLAEIAQKLDLSLSAVKVTIHRVIKGLKEKQKNVTSDGAEP